MAVVVGVIALAVLLGLSVRFSLLKYLMLTVLGIIKIFNSFVAVSISGGVSYVCFGTLFLMVAMDDVCFDLDTKPYSEVIIKKIGDRVRVSEPIWNPIGGFFGALLGSVLIVGIAVWVCSLLNLSIVLTIISIIESIISIISLIQWIKNYKVDKR